MLNRTKLVKFRKPKWAQIGDKKFHDKSQEEKQKRLNIEKSKRRKAKPNNK